MGFATMTKDMSRSVVKLLSDLDAKYQRPDKIEITKQWDEYGRYKGELVTCRWDGINSKLVIVYDITHHYTRVLGDIDSIPLFERGKHKYRDK